MITYVILVLLFLQAHSLIYPAFNGFQLNELNSITLTKFELQTHPWTMTGLKTSKNSTMCGTYNVILGGLGIFNSSAVLTRIIPDLPPHTSIFFQLSFSLIDDLKTSDSFTLTLDNTSIPGGANLGQYTPYFTSNTCGNSSLPDTTEFTIMGSLPHNASNLTLEVTSLISSAAGFGIRDLSISFSNETLLSNPSSCYRINNTKVFRQTGECQCPQGFYFNGTKCLSCDSNCLDCYGPSASQCYSCAYGSSFNGTECISCSSSCLTCTGPNRNECVVCKYPYWKQRNGTCTSSCSLPVVYRQVAGTFQVCSTSCKDQEFMFWNGTCGSSCPFPLLQRVIDQNHICSKPCPSGYFYYQNGSCLSRCRSPWVQSTQNGIDFCSKPCQTGEFYYWNGTCLPTCPSVFVQSQVNQVDSCKKPCPNSADYYYPSDESCHSFCESPNIAQENQSIKICSQGSSPLSPQEIQSINSISGTIDKTGTVATSGVAASSLVSSGNPNLIALISLLKMLEYIRYININYPPKLQLMLDLQDKGSLSKLIDTSKPENIQENFPEYPLPGRFADYKELQSSFILNYWGALFTISLTILMLAISMLFARFANSIAWVKNPFEKLRDLIKWNLLLLIFCSNIDGVGVFSSLQLRNISFDSWPASCGFLICIFVNLLVICLLIKIPLVISSLQKAKCQVFPLINSSFWQEKYKNCRVIFGTFHDTSFLRQSCLFFILLRVYLFNLTIGYLFEYPLLQALLITFLSILMLTYLVFQRPYRSKLELLKIIVYESVILMINACVLILACLDNNDFEASNLRICLGDIIIISNMIFSLFAVAFLVIEITMKLIKTFKFSRSLRKKGLKYWLAIIKFLLQAEEMEKKNRVFPDFQQKDSSPKNLQILPLYLQQNNQESPNHLYSKSPLLPDLFHSPSPLNNSIILGSTFSELAGTPRAYRPSLRERAGPFSSRLQIMTHSSLEGNSKKINSIVNHFKSQNKNGSIELENDKQKNMNERTQSSFSGGDNHLVNGERKNKSLLVALERSKKFLLSQNEDYSIKKKNSLIPGKGLPKSF